MKKLEFYNEYHLGDCIFHLHYLRHLDKNIDIDFYVSSNYINELGMHIKGYNNINLKNITNYNKSGYNSWIGEIYFLPENWTEEVMLYDKFYLKWFDYLSNKIGVDNPVKDMLFDYELLGYNSDFNYDILFINSIPYSAQITYPINIIDKKAIELSKNFNIITTRKINNLPCTLDYNMNLINIAQISNNVSYIIGINTAPIILTMNKFNISKVKEYYIIDSNKTYSYNNVYHLKTLDDILEFKIKC
ncbi:MAG: hypothetical protein RBR68_07385 [Tenuifilaceae bacterium]|nr:hypothetical protein [Tenuifilaceae bacterium]